MEIARNWRLKKQRYALVGQTCPICQTYQFPPRPVCLKCSQQVNDQRPANRTEDAFLVTTVSVAACGD